MKTNVEANRKKEAKAGLDSSPSVFSHIRRFIAWLRRHLRALAHPRAARRARLAALFDPSPR